MAHLESDIMGQVARLPLKPSEANALLPLHEAISNALHAITDRFGDQALADKGRIEIEILFLCRNRNAIGRLFCRLKDFRRVPTRYDRNAVNFRAAVCISAAVSYWL